MPDLRIVNPSTPLQAPTRTDAGAPPALTIDVVYDFVCPWCLIGKRHLATALEQLARLRPQLEPQVRWHSIQLLPDTPWGGVPYQSFYVARLGSPEAVAARRAQVQQAGDAAGLRFAFERIRVMPNTAAAHDLVACVAGQGTAAQQAALIDRLFAAYFLEGEDVGDPAVLERAALACGYTRAGVADHLADTQRRRSVRARQPLPAEYGMNGVPLFVLNGSLGLAGAQAPQTLLDAMLRALGD